MTEMLESVESGDWPIDVRVNWTDTTEWKNKCFDFRSQDLLPVARIFPCNESECPQGHLTLIRRNLSPHIETDNTHSTLFSHGARKFMVRQFSFRMCRTTWPKTYILCDPRLWYTVSHMCALSYGRRALIHRLLFSYHHDIHVDNYKHRGEWQAVNMGHFWCPVYYGGSQTQEWGFL